MHRSRVVMLVCAAVATLLTPGVAAASSGFGDHSEGAYAGLGIGTSGTVPMKLALFATDKGRRIDVPGYFRVEAQLQRAVMDRPKLDGGAAYNNFGMHGGYMGLDLGPLCFGAGFGFDFLTVGLEEVGPKKVSGSHMVLAFGIEGAVGLRLSSYVRLLLTLQYDVAKGSVVDDMTRTGFTADLMFAIGRTGAVIFVSLENGGYSNKDGSIDFSAGQATIGLGIGSNQ